MYGKYGGLAEQEVVAGYFDVLPTFPAGTREDIMRPYKDVVVYVKNHQRQIVQKTMRGGFIPSSWRAGVSD